MMSDADQRLLQSIQATINYEYEPRKYGEPDSDTEVGSVAESDHSEETVILSPSHSGRQTGPKGVIADYKYHQQKERVAKKQEYEELVQMLDRQALSGKSSERRSQINSEHLDDIDEETEFLKSYREHRRKQLRGASLRPKFGIFKEIGVQQYVDAIEKENPETTVIIHLYENYNPHCRLLNRHFTTLAQKYGFVKFLRIRSLSADPDFDPIALPTVLVYKSGDLICNLVRVVDEIAAIGGVKEMKCLDEEFAVEEVEEVLISHNVLTDSDLCERYTSRSSKLHSSASASNSHLRGSGTNNDDDWEDDD